MRRTAAFAALLLVAGCQGDDSRYDAAAMRKARAVAASAVTYNGKLVSVSAPKERSECTEAQPFVAGRCLDVVVTRDLPVIGKPGGTVRDRTHVFVWLERSGRSWIVSNTAQWSPDIVVTIERVEGAEPAPFPYAFPGAFSP